MFWRNSNAKKIALGALERYRRLLMCCHSYPSKGIMSAGVSCQVEDPTINITHGDVIHPCVRYIEEGFEGHQWWMVYTPFYEEQDKLENPRLCYANAEEGEPPTEWKFYCNIAETPEKGYNSDPTMLFHDGQLYVIWREFETPNAMANGYTRQNTICKIENKHVTYLSEPILGEIKRLSDKEVSSTVIPYGKGFRAYAIHIDFVPKYILQAPSCIGHRLYNYKIVFLLDALGIYDINHSHGIAIWDSESLEQTFCYKKTVQFENSSRLYQPWHMEVIKDSINRDKTLHAIVQSRQRHGRICIAKSTDGEKFRFYKKPLLTSKNTDSIGLYKSSAVLVGRKFYLFYTLHDRHDYNLHRLHVTSADWNELISKLE